jgi:hypothetical protein
VQRVGCRQRVRPDIRDSLFLEPVDVSPEKLRQPFSIWVIDQVEDEGLVRG